MKKVLAFLLVAIMVVALAACGGDETSKTPAGDDSSVAGESTPVEDSDPAESTPDEDSTPAESTPDDESVPDESVPEESVPTDESGNVIEIPEDTNKYLSYGAPNTGDRIEQADSVVLTGYNEELAYGAVILYDARFGAATPAGLEDYAVLVAEYQAKPYFGYVKTAYYAVGEASAAVNIPADGFVVVVHKYQESDVKALAAYGADDSIYPHGIQVKDITWNATFVANAPAQDGVVNANEYGAVVSHVDVDNPDWDYAQFAATEDYDIVADIYVAYDAEYLYYAVVVEMDYHYCPNATSLWDQCSIQVNIATKAPTSEYMSQHYDYIVDNTAEKDGVIGQYGYAVTDAGTAVSEAFMGATKPADGTYMVTRDETNQTTTYEVKISWEDIGFEEAPDTGASFGLSFSLNARKESGDGNWTNVKMRNGGGIIGRNDWSKMATVVLK
ncbi:MAG: hypothetical protein II987_09670 [Clostridia bacterium]|nr:hypothetical protein [Clostridia bacterium]